MIQKSTLLWIFLAIIAGVSLFHTSEEVHQAASRLEEAQSAIADEKENLRVLEAEWSYLNQPERLEKLSQQILPLKSASGEQLADMDHLTVKPAPVAKPAAKIEEEKLAVSPVAAQKKAEKKNASLQGASKARSFSAVLASLGVGAQ